MATNIMPVPGRNYIMTSRVRADQPCVALQPNTVIDGDMAIRRTKIKVNAAEFHTDKDGRRYCYFNYEPIMEDAGRCAFGWDKVYTDPDNQPKFATTLAAIA